MSYSSLVKIPADSAINGGLTSPKNSDMIRIFGVPSTKKTVNCAAPNNPKLAGLIVTENVGPFRATGIKPAIASLKRIFAKVKKDKPELYEAIKTAGMSCCRLQRTSKTLWSNHSFGTAIDLYCGSAVVPQGSDYTHQGILELYPYFHNEGWYWGAEFGKADGMHYEVSLEKLNEWDKAGVI